MEDLGTLGLDRLQVQKARSGDFTAVINGRSLLSAYDPRREAARQAESVAGSPVTVAGLGLGFLALALGPRLARVLAFRGEIERLKRHISRDEDAQVLSRVEEFATLRELELALFAAAGRGEGLLVDPTVQASPGLAARLDDLVLQLTGRPRACFIHLKTAGDILRTFPAIQSWRRAKPGVEITLLVEEPYGELAALAEGIDRVVEVAQGTDSPPPDLGRPLFAANFGCELQPARILHGLNPLFAAGYRAGRDDREPALVDDRNPQHASELREIRNRMNRSHFYSALLGVPPTGNPPSLSVPSGTVTGAQVVQFGAGSGAPVWAPKRSDPRELSEALSAIGGRWVAVGGADEAAIAAEAGIRGEDNYCGRTTWPQLAGLLSGAALFVGHDSGPTHLAAALGTPTLALFGFTSPILNAPIGPRTLTVQADMPCAFGGCRVPCPEIACTAALTAEAIAAAVEHLQATINGDIAGRLRTAAMLRGHGLRAFYPGSSVEDVDPLRPLLEAEPRLGPPIDPALSLLREWLESTAR